MKKKASKTKALKRNPWACAGCDTTNLDAHCETCPKCGSEDVFPMNDKGWPCGICKQPMFNYNEMKAGKCCAGCNNKVENML